MLLKGLEHTHLYNWVQNCSDQLWGRYSGVQKRHKHTARKADIYLSLGPGDSSVSTELLCYSQNFISIPEARTKVQDVVACALVMPALVGHMAHWLVSIIWLMRSRPRNDTWGCPLVPTGMNTCTHWKWINKFRFWCDEENERGHADDFSARGSWKRGPGQVKRSFWSVTLSPLQNKFCLLSGHLQEMWVWLVHLGSALEKRHQGHVTDAYI